MTLKFWIGGKLIVIDFLFYLLWLGMCWQFQFLLLRPSLSSVLGVEYLIHLGVFYLLKWLKVWFVCKIGFSHQPPPWVLKKIWRMLNNLKNVRYQFYSIFSFFILVQYLVLWSYLIKIFICVLFLELAKITIDSSAPIDLWRFHEFVSKWISIS